MKYVVARITGGLGNQLLNYAVALGVAERTGRGVVLDLTDFLIFCGGRRYQLNHFVGPARARHWNLFKTAGFLFAWIVNKRVSPRFFAWYCRAARIRVLRSDKILDFDPCFVDAGLKESDDLLYLIGVYGHTTYLPSDAALRDALRLTSEPEGQNRLILEQVVAADSVSLHVRRSDYLQVSNGSVALGAKYYRGAIEEMARRVAHPLWVVFSDDIPWCRTEFAALGNVIFVDGNGDRPWEDLRLMMACRHHVIANSSFSWWGACLGRDPAGLVCYPEHWFPNEKTRPTAVRTGWIPSPSHWAKEED